ncbi:hypothetical protein HZ994_17850 [Akkermansiaceae bacterium]|nr:hypothetical protein HZ994_17850 [Akkermansiaceae bacterium]
MDTLPMETPLPAKKGRPSCLLIAAIVFVLLIVSVAGAYFWYNRPIKPVELSAQETQALEQKIESMEAAPDEPDYQPGSKEIVITERELNGLLAQNTDLGDKLKFTLATDEIHARIETDLDEGMPVVGGKKLKAKARFLVGDADGKPSLMLDDLTVWGASLPNDWLGGMKGKDLLAELFGGGKISGIEELRIERGRLVIRLAE